MDRGIVHDNIHFCQRNTGDRFTRFSAKRNRSFVRLSFPSPLPPPRFVAYSMEGQKREKEKVGKYYFRQRGCKITFRGLSTAAGLFVDPHFAPPIRHFLRFPTLIP